MKKLSDFIRSHRGLCSAVSLVLLTSLILWAVNSPAVVGVSASERQLPVYCVQRDDKTAALSFDAAWGNEDTQTLIDILGKYGVKATFFVVGQWVDKYPESVKALADAGHEVMNHSNDHAHFASLSAEEISKNIGLANDKIEKITGVRPTLFRCPYGEYNDTAISTVRGMGMTPVQWDVDSLDWKELPADEICSRVLKNVKSGSIVLFHNAAKHTPEALPAILEALISDGYKLVPVSELLLTGKTMIDSTGRQCPAYSEQSAPPGA